MYDKSLVWRLLIDVLPEVLNNENQAQQFFQLFEEFDITEMFGSSSEEKSLNQNDILYLFQLLEGRLMCLDKTIRLNCAEYSIIQLD